MDRFYRHQPAAVFDYHGLAEYSRHGCADIERLSHAHAAAVAHDGAFFLGE